MSKKKNKNGKLENFIISILPFSARTTKTLLVAFAIFNFAISGMLFSQTIQEEKEREMLAQNFIERVNNTRSIK
ncbi:hypothetical protein GW764_00910 [Candidatus Parcubacteria bacterium]|nr:hypothetical protein [Candidatus Parcubacteria bacterium]